MGVLVYEMENYGNTENSENVFKGLSMEELQLIKEKNYRVGTYFYIINFSKTNLSRRSYSGYLYLNE